MNTPKSDLYLTNEKRSKVEPLEGGVKAQVRASPNLAIKKNGAIHDVVRQIVALASGAKNSFEYNRQKMQEKWVKADNYYWLLEKQHRLPELSVAKVAASTFYRACRRLQDGAFITTFATDDLPVKMFPTIEATDLPEVKECKTLQALAINKCAADYFAKQRIKEDPSKAKQAYHQIYKYGNCIVYTPYDFQVCKKKYYEDEDVNEKILNEKNEIEYVHSKTGEVSKSPFKPESKVVEKEYILKDEVGFYPVPIQNIWMDDRIENINRQTYFIHRSDISRQEIFTEAHSGRFLNVEDITEEHKYQLFSWENQVEYQRRNDSGKDTTHSQASEMYEHWRCWIMMPKIDVKTDKKGEVIDLEWDQNAEPRRYLLECVGSLTGNNVVVNFRESPYWSNNVPYIMAHSHDDDSGAYHRGLLELLDDNWIQEAVAKGQLMDNRRLLNYRPMQWLKGRVMNKSPHITHNTVFTVLSQDAIKQMDVSDISGTIANTLGYLREESESIAQVPKFAMGEAMGARTSATEFAAIRDAGSAPALTDIKSINMQLFGGYMQKIVEYLPQFEADQIHVAAEGREYLVSTDKIEESDIMIKEVAIQEYDNKQTTRQVFSNLLGTVLSNPMFQGIVNPAGLFLTAMKLYPELSQNPEMLLINNPQIKQLLLEYYNSQNKTIGEMAGIELPGKDQDDTALPSSQPAPIQPDQLNQSMMAGNMEAQPINAALGAMGGM